MKRLAQSTAISSVLASVLLAFGGLPQVLAQDLFPIIPGIGEGNSFLTIPFSGGPDSVRFQQVYAAGGFTDLGFNGPFLIRRLEFRVDMRGPGFSSDFPSFQVNLSTTSRSVDGLSPIFSENIGSDDTAVIPLGPFHINGDFVIGNNPQIFMSLITLPTPFYYDPSQGNLLLDIRNFGGGTTTWGIPPFTGLAYVDASNVAGDRVSSVFGAVNATSGTADSLGLVTQFWMTPVPEPSTLALLALGLAAAVLNWRRLKRGKESKNVAS